MSDTFKDRVKRALEEAAAKARDVAKTIGLRPSAPRFEPVPIPVRSRK